MTAPAPAAPATATPPHDGSKWVGLGVAFDHNGKRLVGVVTAVAWAGFTERGVIPDYTLTIRGKSGALLTVSLVETHANIDS